MFSKLSKTIVIFGLTFQYVATVANADVLPSELARAAKFAYEKNLINFDRQYINLGNSQTEYVVFDQISEKKYQDGKFHGLQAITLVDDQNKNIIISFRGTDTGVRENLSVDAGIAALATKEDFQKHLDKYAEFYGLGTHKKVATTFYNIGNFLYNSSEIIGSVASRFDHPVANTIVAGTKMITGAKKSINKGQEIVDITRMTPEGFQSETEEASAKAVQYYWSTMAKISKTISSDSVENDDQPGCATRVGRKAAAYLAGAQYCPPSGYNVYITGHSLGGFLAQVVGSQAINGCRPYLVWDFSGTDSSAQRIKTYTFNAPGAVPFIQSHQSFRGYQLPPRKYAGFFINFHRKNDIVGTFLHHVGQSRSVLDFHEGPSFYRGLPDGAEAKNLVNQANASFVFPEKDILVSQAKVALKDLAFKGGYFSYLLGNHGIDSLIADFAEAEASLKNKLNGASYLDISGILASRQPEVALSWWKSNVDESDVEESDADEFDGFESNQSD